MRRSALLVLFLVMAATAGGYAQTVESANSRQFAIDVGAMGSAFNPHDGNQKTYPTDTNTLVGAGTYVDLHFTHWFQLEGEARWLRWNTTGAEKMDNYLVGPRVPIKEFGRAQLYGKAMIGYGKMTFPFGYGYGSFTNLAFGGTLDYRLSRKLTLRAVDFEYQDWPKWLNNSSLYPYGVSVGVAYRVY